jgi:hypothetical protein
MKPPASARKSSRSSASSKAAPRTPAKASKELVICVKNDGYEASLEVRKIYRTLEDGDAQAHCLLRVIDESGEDYLYPRANFLPIILPLAARRAVLAAS